jgi:hypothetical protein
MISQKIMDDNNKKQCVMTIIMKPEIHLTIYWLENQNDDSIAKTYTGCPRTGSPEKKGSLRANILTCILNKKSPISNDNREKTL